jgi:hypothetical protein
MTAQFYLQTETNSDKFIFLFIVIFSFLSIIFFNPSQAGDGVLDDGGNPLPTSLLHFSAPTLLLHQVIFYPRDFLISIQYIILPYGFFSISLRYRLTFYPTYSSLMLFRYIFRYISDFYPKYSAFLLLL